MNEELTPEEKEKRLAELTREISHGLGEALEFQAKLRKLVRQHGIGILSDEQRKIYEFYEEYFPGEPSTNN